MSGGNTADFSYEVWTMHEIDKLNSLFISAASGNISSTNFE